MAASSGWPSIGGLASDGPVRKPLTHEALTPDRAGARDVGSNHRQPVRRFVASAARSSPLELIGRTPLVELDHFVDDSNVRLLVKLEGHNLIGSVKDRPALRMVRDAVDGRRLRPGMRILEASSGNTGIALAAVGACFGYGVTILAPSSITAERKQMLEFYGANLVETPPDLGTKGSFVEAERMADRHPEYCWMNHGEQNV